MMRADSDYIYRLLDGLKIKYRGIKHTAANTMEDLQEAEALLGATFCKNLFLANRQGTEHFLLLIRGDKRFRTAEVSKKLGKARLSFGSEDRLWEFLGVKPGAITPLGLVFDKQHQLTLVVDKDLLGLDSICIHPCVNTESLVMATTDLFDVFIPHCGHKPVMLEITGTDE